MQRPRERHFISSKKHQSQYPSNASESREQSLVRVVEKKLLSRKSSKKKQPLVTSLTLLVTSKTEVMEQSSRVQNPLSLTLAYKCLSFIANSHKR